MEQWNSVCGTVLWNSAGETVERGTVWWNNEIVKVEQCGGTVEQCWWNSGTVLVE